MPSTIARQPVTSSNIKSAGYHEDSQTLAVEFQNGHLWHYSPVPKPLATEFMGASSKGAHFARNIRGKFTEERQTVAPPQTT